MPGPAHLIFLLHLFADLCAVLDHLCHQRSSACDKVLDFSLAGCIDIKSDFKRPGYARHHQITEGIKQAMVSLLGMAVGAQISIIRNPQVLKIGIAMVIFGIYY